MCLKCIFRWSLIKSSELGFNMKNNFEESDREHGNGQLAIRKGRAVEESLMGLESAMEDDFDDLRRDPALVEVKEKSIGNEVQGFCLSRCLPDADMKDLEVNLREEKFSGELNQSQMMIFGYLPKEQSDSKKSLNNLLDALEERSFREGEPPLIREHQKNSKQNEVSDVQRCLQRQQAQLEKAVCKLTFYWFDQNKKLDRVVQGSGFFIDGQHILTARHNFHSKKDDRKCQNCQIQVMSSENKLITLLSTPAAEWFQHHKYDLGLVKLQKKIQNFTNYVEFCNQNDISSIQSGQQMKISGYSIEYRKKNSQRIVYSDQLQTLSAEFKRVDWIYMEYTSDTACGLSGSPVILRTEGNKFYVAGMHLSRKALPSQDCRGLLFTSDIVHQINFWRRSPLIKDSLVSTEIEMLKDRFTKQLQRVLLLSKLQNQNLSKKEVVTCYEKLICNDPSNEANYKSSTENLVPLLGVEQTQLFFTNIRQKLNFSMHIDRELQKVSYQRKLREKQQEEKFMNSLMSFKLGVYMLEDDISEVYPKIVEKASQRVKSQRDSIKILNIYGRLQYQKYLQGEYISESENNNFSNRCENKEIVFTPEKQNACVSLQNKVSAKSKFTAKDEDFFEIFERQIDTNDDSESSYQEDSYIVVEVQ